nr:Pfs25/MSP8 fusion protein [synthetic construct]
MAHHHHHHPGGSGSGTSKVTVDTVCKRGFLIQMSGHLECKCENDLVLVNEETCEEKVLKCDEKTVNKPCGDFSKCIKIDGNPVSYACKCNLGYDMVNNVCIPNECKNVTCGNGKCILDTSNPVKTGVCSCNIGKVPNVQDQNKCSKDGETKCSLKCLKENETCKAVDGIYKCDCKDGFIIDNESSICTLKPRGGSGSGNLTDTKKEGEKIDLGVQNKKQNIFSTNNKGLNKYNIDNELKEVDALLKNDNYILNKYHVSFFNNFEEDTYNKKKFIRPYDLSLLKSILIYRQRVTRNSVNVFQDLNAVFGKSYNKDDTKLSITRDKVKKELSRKNRNFVEYLIEMLENTLNSMNDDFINKDNFDLNNYVKEFELINYLLIHEDSDIFLETYNLISGLNSNIEETSIEKLKYAILQGKQINYKIKDDIYYILKNAYAKYFKIDVYKKGKLLYPTLYYHRNAFIKSFVVEFFNNNKVCENTKCPLNSNCYVIDDEETCRCLPGFNNIKIDDEMNCVRDDTLDCSRNNGGCDIHAKCSFINKQIVCECKDKFEGDGIYCS